jgi:NADPH:quinone reductase-like Zn-dependent oxidoreductase
MSERESNAVLLERPGPLPKPIKRAASSPRRQEVLLRVRGSSINFHDYVFSATAAGENAPYPLKWPRVPFSDACGEIVALGEDVTGFAVGDRVIPNFFPYWLDGRPATKRLSTVYGDQLDGGLQTYMVAEAQSLAMAPSHLSDREAGTLGCAGLTAWRAVFDEARLRPSDVVLIQGTGGVSLFALGFAKMVGACVIITSSSDEKLERARALGADHVINYRADPDWDRKALEITDGRGANLIVEVGGGGTLAKSISAAALDGHVSVIGVLTGFESETFPLASVMQKNLSVRGITVGSQSQLSDMCESIARNRYHPVLDKDFPLDDAEGAMQWMLSQRHFGKITVSIGD